MKQKTKRIIGILLIVMIFVSHYITQEFVPKKLWILTAIIVIVLYLIIYFKLIQKKK